MEKSTDLIKKNQLWNKEFISQRPFFFENSSKGQKPKYLWIGCADSRVPESIITNTLPGEIFVHRNIANQIIITDLNSMSVIYFALNILKIRQVIVCGHYSCGGVEAVYNNADVGIINDWLSSLKYVYDKHKFNIIKKHTREEKLNYFCELNVFEQVANICKSDCVQNIWKSDLSLKVHGYIYDLKTGLLKDLNISNEQFYK